MNLMFENIIVSIAFGLFGYISGSLAFSVWVTHKVTGNDVRERGSKHATTTNTIRQAGWQAGALVFFLDIVKGYLPVWLALTLAPGSSAAALAAGGAVIGHCWPLFAGFRGGMGLATTGGALLAVSPLGFLISFGVLLAWVLAIRHAARGTVLTALSLPMLLWISGFRGEITWISLASCSIIALRFLIDWNRKYRELWLDREKTSQPPIAN